MITQHTTYYNNYIIKEYIEKDENGHIILHEYFNELGQIITRIQGELETIYNYENNFLVYSERSDWKYNEYVYGEWSIPQLIKNNEFVKYCAKTTHFGSGRKYSFPT